MKRILWTALLFVGSVCVAPAAGLQPKGGHPRLFFTAERIAAVTDRIQREKSSADAWAAIRAAADKAVEKPESAGRNVEQLAFAYRMTGDKRYAAVLRDYLVRETRRREWEDADLLRRDPVWHAGLGLARVLSATSLAFDSIHDFLSPDERREIARGIVELGVLPTLNDWVLGANRIHSLDTMGHNWWSACVFTAGLGALAVMDEEPRAGQWLNRISEGSPEWFGYAGSLIENKPANFDRAGGFYESVNYASFALSEYLQFRLAWTNALQNPPPEIPILPKVGDFFINVSYPNTGHAMTLNFGDGSIHADGSRPLALLWANGIRRPEFAWYLAANREMSYREGIDRTSPLGLVYFPTDAELAAAPATPDLPRAALYGDMGWAALRTSWDKDATLLGVKSGYTWNHSHADEGSFILFHRGQNLIIDSGNCGYSKPEYDAFYRQSVAHNVVLFNGQAENPEDTYYGSKFPGSLSHLIDVGDLKYLFADATGPTTRLFDRNYRHFLWLGDVILVIDDVEAFEPGQFEWLLHVDGKVERKGLDLMVSKEGAGILVRPLFPAPFPDAGLPTDYPEDMRLVEKTGLTDHDEKTKLSYYAFAPPEPTRRTKFITAITLVTDRNKDHLPNIERLTGPEVIGVRIRQDGTTSDVYLNLRADGRIRHRNANNTLGGWETDAYLLALSYQDSAGAPATIEAASRVFIADGSYLRRDGVVALDSLSKAFTTWTTANGSWDLVLQGQPTAKVRIHASAAPNALRVNGTTIPATFDADAKQIVISR